MAHHFSQNLDTIKNQLKENKIDSSSIKKIESQAIDNVELDYNKALKVRRLISDHLLNENMHSLELSNWLNSLRNKD